EAELVTFRRESITGLLYTVAIKKYQVDAQRRDEILGIAAGDLVIPRKELAIPAPQVRWRAVTGAERYHLWRRVEGKANWIEVYAGKDTAYADPVLLPQLDAGIHFQYQVGVDKGGACIRNPWVLLAQPTAPPPALLPLMKAKASPFAPASQPALETLMSCAVAPLTAALDLCKTDDERRWLLHALAATRDPNAIEPLAQAYKNNATLRRLTGWELARFGSAGLQRLAALAAKGEDAFSLEVVRSLASAGQPSIPFLTGFLHDVRPKIQDAACEGFSTVGPQALKAALTLADDADGEVRCHGAEILGRIGDGRALQPLINLSVDPEARVRAAAVGALGKLLADAPGITPTQGEQATDYLLAALNDPDPTVRARAAAAVGNTKSPRAFLPICALLKDPVDKVRAAVPTALYNLGDARSVDVLCAQLRSAQGNELSTIAGYLGWLHSPHAVAPLIALLGSREASTRLIAAWALGMLGDSRAILPLLALYDKDPAVRSEVADALRNCCEVPVSADARRQVEGPLLARLKAKDEDARMLGITLCGELRLAKALPTLLTLAQSGGENTRGRAIAMLAHYQDPRAAAAIMAAYRTSSPEVRKTATVALGACGDDRALSVLLADTAPTNRRWVVEGLGRSGDFRAAGALLNMLATEEDIPQIVYLLEALCNFQDPRAIGPLLAKLRDPHGYIRERAILALGSAAGSHLSRLVDPLLRVLCEEGMSPEDDTFLERYAAVNLLGKSGDARAIAPLIGELAHSDRQMCGNIVRALKSLTGQDYGFDVEAWNTWQQEQEHTAPAKPKDAKQ
ncbi:MAG TPA: HEAT repeat domain-containing protein, partial [Armatimonadota bacterium]